MLILVDSNFNVVKINLELKGIIRSYYIMNYKIIIAILLLVIANPQQQSLYENDQFCEVDLRSLLYCILENIQDYIIQENNLQIMEMNFLHELFNF